MLLTYFLCSLTLSGAHMNAAVSFTMCAFGRLAWKMLPLYVFVQLLGSFLAAGTIYGVYYGESTFDTDFLYCDNFRPEKLYIHLFLTQLYIRHYLLLYILKIIARQYCFHLQKPYMTIVEEIWLLMVYGPQLVSLPPIQHHISPCWVDSLTRYTAGLKDYSYKSLSDTFFALTLSIVVSFYIQLSWHFVVMFALCMCVCQVFGTAMLLLCLIALSDQRNKPAAAGSEPVTVGLLVLLIGISLGSNSGYAINPTRDIAPRVFTAIAGWGLDVFRYRVIYW